MGGLIERLRKCIRRHSCYGSLGNLCRKGAEIILHFSVEFQLLRPCKLQFDNSEKRALSSERPSTCLGIIKASAARNSQHNSAQLHNSRLNWPPFHCTLLRHLATATRHPPRDHGPMRNELFPPWRLISFDTSLLIGPLGA